MADASLGLLDRGDPAAVLRDFASDGFGHFGVETDPTAAARVAFLPAFVQEVVLVFLVDLPIVVPFLRRKALLELLNHFLQRELTLSCSLNILVEVLKTGVDEDVEQNLLHVV